MLLAEPGAQPMLNWKGMERMHDKELWKIQCMTRIIACITPVLSGSHVPIIEVADISFPILIMTL